MGQQVYVLMALEGSGKNRNWRPMGVVTNPEVAEQWEHYGGGVDWVPFELDDIKDITPEKMPTFQPRKLSPGEERVKQLAENMEATIQRLQKIIDDQAGVIKRLSGKKSASTEWAKELTPHEAWEYAEQLHDGQIVQDYFFIAGGSDDLKDKRPVIKYVLQTVETKKLLGVQDDMLTDSYAGEPSDTQPPLVVNAHGVVIDGTHRLGAALRRGDENVLAYVPVVDKDL